MKLWRPIPLLVGAVLFPMPVHGAVLISEVAWMGDAESSNNEWIEIANTSSANVDLTGWRLVADDGSPEISFEDGVEIAAGEYAVLERTDDDSAPSAAFLIYTGALSNSGEILRLHDANGVVVDEVNGSDGWGTIGGDNDTKDTAQRTDSGWATAAPTPGSGSLAGESDGSDDVGNFTPPQVDSIIRFDTVTIEPPPDIYLRVPERIETTAGSLVRFEAEVYDAQGRTVKDVRFSWALGDGTAWSESIVVHRYRHAGTYMAVVRAETESLYDEVHIPVTVHEPHVALVIDDTGNWIGIQNKSEYSLDISSWRVQAAYQYFVIPERTVVPPNQTVRFDKEVTGLTMLLASDGVWLYLPSEGGVIAEGEIEKPETEDESAEPESSGGKDVDTTATSVAVVQPFVSSGGTSIVGTRVTSAAPAASGVHPESSTPRQQATKASTTAHFVAAAAASDQSGPNSFLWYGALAGIMGLAVAGALIVRRSQRNDWEITEE